MKKILLADGPDFLKPLDDREVQKMVDASEERVRQLHVNTEVARQRASARRLAEIRAEAERLGIKISYTPSIKKVG